MNTSHQTLTVALDERSYPIHIGCGLLGNAALWAPHLNPKMGAVVITNTTVAPLIWIRCWRLWRSWAVRLSR